jgi:formylglycine-generating enzyme required for sulfatase activity
LQHLQLRLRILVSLAACAGLIVVLDQPGIAARPAAARQAAAAAAKPPADSKPYSEIIPDTKVAFDMVPIPGGSFTMGSPASEAGRAEDEGPPVKVTMSPFYMSAHEVTWDEYDLFAFRKRTPLQPGQTPSPADAVTKPTPPYADETWGFGKGKQPALGMTWHAAAEYCRWLSAKTGKLYRLPTEAEWEYAARAGTTTAWTSGKDAASLEAVAWFTKNSNGQPHPVAMKKPNAWGLFDMEGNVAEWTLDQYNAGRYASLASQKSLLDPVLVPGEARYPHVVRGGSFDDDPEKLRNAARRFSKPDWSRRDPQQPQSIWWHTDAIFVGFRIVQPVQETDALKGFRSKITRESPDQ